LPERGLADRTAVFQLMGAAHEQMGDFQNAARCYSAQMPE
jgi:hypothetical protein